MGWTGHAILVDPREEEVIGRMDVDALVTQRAVELRLVDPLLVDGVAGAVVVPGPQGARRGVRTNRILDLGKLYILKYVFDPKQRVHQCGMFFLQPASRTPF